MSKTVLYLEDDGYVRRQTMEALEDDGFRVVGFGRIDLANQYLEEHSDEIDCIITDLNMNDEWLGKYRGESFGCLLSGWVWLRRFVLERKEYRNIPCVIYSGYIQELEQYLKDEKEPNLLKDYHVACVEKGGNDNNGYMALIRRLKACLLTEGE